MSKSSHRPPQAGEGVVPGGWPSPSWESPGNCGCPGLWIIGTARVAIWVQGGQNQPPHPGLSWHKPLGSVQVCRMGELHTAGCMDAPREG